MPRKKRPTPRSGQGRLPKNATIGAPGIGRANYMPLCSKTNDSLVRRKSISVSVWMLALVVSVTISS